ncbi:Pyruvate dehyrogenase phosphatase catalytic subunit [Boothiomyces sp. JEL0838]|nr:Pyruvate dehyrogenase phosphatase catalytic subunit [Boothiomyces sp. JEL0838]
MKKQIVRVAFLTRRLIHGPPGNPKLSTEQIDSILKSQEKSFKVSNDPNSQIHRIDSNTLASNSPSEDAQFQTILKNNAVAVGVIDGHWSNHCANLVSYALPHYIEKYLDEDKRKITLAKAFESLDNALLALPFKALPELSNSPEEIMAIDPEKKKQAIIHSLPTFSGACALTSYVSGDDLYVTHAGDCRAVLGLLSNGKWKAKALTEDHQPSNLRELFRLNKEHPGEENFVVSGSPPRVLGGMMPSRAFGDARYKYTLTDQERIDALVHGVPLVTYATIKPHHLKTPPYMTASPDIANIKITPDTMFLVLATDGLYDMLCNTDIVAHVATYLNSPPARDSNAATYLIRQALSYGKNEEYLSRMLTVNPKHSRSYRDDITVQIIFFKPSILMIDNVNSQDLQRCS